ncbi:MAG: hypothetical protein GY716_13650 [bacterium]|nr:hypothetical protein [bacterium]
MVDAMHEHDDATVTLPVDVAAADVRSLLPFATVLDLAGATTDEEVAAVIAEDAKALIAQGLRVDVGRYASVLDAEPAREAAVAAHADSLATLDGVAPGQAQQRAQAAVLLARRSSPVATSGAVGQRGRRSRGFTTTVATPIVLVIMFLFGGGFSVGTLYWLGVMATAKEVHLQEKLNRLDAEELARQQSELAAAKDAFSDDVVAEIDAILIEAGVDIENAHIADGLETILALERIAEAAVSHDAALPDRVSDAKLDDVVMPTLRLLYRVEELGGEEAMQRVHSLLAELEASRHEKTQTKQ